MWECVWFFRMQCGERKAWVRLLLRTNKTSAAINIVPRVLKTTPFPSSKRKRTYAVRQLMVSGCALQLSIVLLSATKATGSVTYLQCETKTLSIFVLSVTVILCLFFRRVVTWDCKWHGRRRGQPTAAHFSHAPVLPLVLLPLLVMSRDGNNEGRAGYFKDLFGGRDREWINQAASDLRNNVANAIRGAVVTNPNTNDSSNNQRRDSNASSKSNNRRDSHSTTASTPGSRPTRSSTSTSSSSATTPDEPRGGGGGGGSDWFFQQVSLNVS